MFFQALNLLRVPNCTLTLNLSKEGLGWTGSKKGDNVAGGPIGLYHLQNFRIVSGG